MKINETRPANSPSAIKKAKKASASGGVGFADILSQADEAGDSAAAAPVADAATVAAVNNSLLSLQEVPEDEYRDRKAAAQGRITLDKLEDLRHQLLSGTIAFSTLRNLEQVIESQRKFTAFDPRLKEILDEIELRAAVELAKLERAKRHE